nr:hypothetical protein [Tanacetum cinerariifolium]
ENLVSQPEEVLDIHRTLAEIESPVLYWWGYIRSCRNRIGQLIELNVNSFHDASGPFLVDSMPFPAWSITNKYSSVSCWLKLSKICAVVCRIAKCTKDSEKLATASAHRNIGALENISIVRAASTRVRFRLSTTPFCWGVLELSFDERCR